MKKGPCGPSAASWGCFGLGLIELASAISPARTADRDQPSTSESNTLLWTQPASKAPTMGASQNSHS